MLVDVIRLIWQLRPITGFTCLFEGNLKLGNEIFPSLRIVGSVYIRANGSTGTSDLIGDNGFVFGLQVFYKVDNDVTAFGG